MEYPDADGIKPYFQPAVNIFNPLAHLGANNAAQQAMMQAGMQYAPRTGDRRSTRVEARLWRGSSDSSVPEHLHTPLLQASRVIGMPTRPSAPPTKMYPHLTHAQHLRSPVRLKCVRTARAKGMAA
jgi:hypothetical protein